MAGGAVRAWVAENIARSGAHTHASVVAAVRRKLRRIEPAGHQAQSGKSTAAGKLEAGLARARPEEGRCK